MFLNQGKIIQLIKIVSLACVFSNRASEFNNTCDSYTGIYDEINKYHVRVSHISIWT